MKILIKGTNWIGDAVMSIPAMRLIRAAFPGASVALHTRKWAIEVFTAGDLFDELIGFEPAGNKFSTVLQQSRILRTYRFDAAVLLPNSFESAMTVTLAGIPKRWGYSTDGRRLLLTDALPVPQWKSERHESNYYSELALRFVESLGGGPASVPPFPEIDVSAAQRIGAKKVLGALPIAAEKPLIALGAGSTNSLAKRWPTDHFARLCDLFSEHLQAEILLLGSRDEIQVGRDLQASTQAVVHDLTGTTDLGTAIGLLAAVDLFISNDMGLAHISSALGTPTMTLFGPTNENTTAPRGPNTRFIREVVECSPCLLRTCPVDHRCMIRLTPERVFEAAVGMLQNRKS